MKIDLNNRYPTQRIYQNKGYSEFDAILKNGEKARMGIVISPTVHPLLPFVHNLAFGPMDANNQINDQAQLSYNDYNTVFSTVIFEAMSFPTQNPEKFIGIDGSNMARSYMYFRCL